MASSVLIVGNGSAFMLESLRSNLTDAGFFPVEICSTGDKKFKRKLEQTDFFLLYASDELFAAGEALTQIRDITMNDDSKAVFVIGYQDEINLMSSILSSGCIAQSFVRPFDMKKVSAELIEQEEYIKELLEQKKSTEQKVILLVDDDVMYLKMMQGWLSERYKVNIVKTGMQAISYITKNRPDLILLDYEMPVASGPQVLEMIRSDTDCGDIPVIFLTGKSDKESVVSVMSLKPQGYMLKSMSKESIMAQVDNFFETNKWKNIEV